MRQDVGGKTKPEVLSRSKLVTALSVEPCLKSLFASVRSGSVKTSDTPYFYLRDGLLMRLRKLRNSTDTSAMLISQIEVPLPYRNDVLSLAQDGLAGHAGIAKTYD